MARYIDIRNRLVGAVTLVLLLFAGQFAANADNLPYTTHHATLLGADTLVSMQSIEVSAIKQNDSALEAASTTTLNAKEVEQRAIYGVKDALSHAPNLFMPNYGSRMTSSIYVRGMGTRIEQPVVGLNIDNLPVADKNMYDVLLPDIERIEIIRGPQSTLYGRNTMGGVINLYTTSPLQYQGVRIAGEYGSRNEYRLALSAYNRFGNNVGLSIATQFSHSDGHFRNTYNNRLCDHEKSGDVRIKFQYRRSALSIDNVTWLSTVKQGGYPYAYMGSLSATEPYPDLIGKVCYNDEASYRRIGINDCLTIRYDWQKVSLASTTSYQYLDDKMVLDQDFLPLSIFTLEQAKRQHDVTEELILRSRSSSPYQWLCGAMLFYKNQQMSAPVEFLKEGIDRLILENVNKHSGYDGTYHWGREDGSLGETLWLGSDFMTHTFGAALYHQSSYRLNRWLFTLGLRFDYEGVQMRYRNRADYYYTAFPNDSSKNINEVHQTIDDSDILSQRFFEILPKLSVAVELGQKHQHKLYLSASKGYKAGGFNTQMFSEVLQRRIQDQMGMAADLDVENIIKYKPEESWNIELGGHFESRDAQFSSDITLFWIECFDQQLTVFPAGTTTGRMMTNAGRSRSVGVEAALKWQPHKNVAIAASYGFTDARFRRFVSGKNDYQGEFVPYAPQHTLTARLNYRIPLRSEWLDSVELGISLNGAGRIYWNERNDFSQPFYALVDASARLNGANWAVEIWARNLTDARYDTFYFESMSNRFLQRGRPLTVGIRASIELFANRSE